MPVPPHTPAQEMTQTATIRNAVNLKKNSLQLVPLPGDPTKLAVRFLLDASSPCRCAQRLLYDLWYLM